jgi:hypothetical protein
MAFSLSYCAPTCPARTIHTLSYLFVGMKDASHVTLPLSHKGLLFVTVMRSMARRNKRKRGKRQREPISEMGQYRLGGSAMRSCDNGNA